MNTRMQLQRKDVLARSLFAGVALLFLLALLALLAQAQTYPAPEVAWHFTEHYGDATDLAVGDLTGNGVADVAFIDNQIIDTAFALYGNNGTEYWSDIYASGYSIAVGDVDGDTRNEVVAGGYNSNAGKPGITVFEDDGTFKFFYETNSQFVKDIELGDLDGDNVADIVACNNEAYGWIYAINGTTGANLTGWPWGSPDSLEDIALGNLDDKPGLDVAAISLLAPGTLYVFNSTGALLWYNESVRGRSVEIGDVDGDTEEEVVIGDYLSKSVIVYDGNSDVLEYAFQTNYRNPTEVELGDLDGDTSDLEIAAITGEPPDASLFALAVNATGQLNELWNFSIEWEPMCYGEVYYGEGLAIGDIDGDGRNEVVAASTPSDLDRSFRVWAFEGLDGDVVWMYELGPSSGARANDVELGDVDGDGDLDVLVATNQAAGSVYALFTKEPPRAPLLAPLGIVALIGLLSVIATSTLVRRKRR
jgi:hypothetical protein